MKMQQAVEREIFNRLNYTAPAHIVDRAIDKLIHDLSVTPTTMVLAPTVDDMSASELMDHARAQANNVCGVPLGAMPHPTQKGVWVPREEGPRETTFTYMGTAPPSWYAGPGAEHITRHPRDPRLYRHPPLGGRRGPLPALPRVVTNPKTGKMETLPDAAGPTRVELEKTRREVRDHITGNGPAWHTDPNAKQPEPPVLGVTTWCELCNRNVTGEPCTTVYGGALKGCFV